MVLYGPHHTLNSNCDEEGRLGFSIKSVGTRLQAVMEF
jgi:hypothetical protein